MLKHLTGNPIGQKPSFYIALRPLRNIFFFYQKIQKWPNISSRVDKIDIPETVGVAQEYIIDTIEVTKVLQNYKVIDNVTEKLTTNDHNIGERAPK